MASRWAALSGNTTSIATFSSFHLTVSFSSRLISPSFLIQHIQMHSALLRLIYTFSTSSLKECLANILIVEAITVAAI